MLRARREARQGGFPQAGYPQPGYPQIGGRSRYRDRNQGYSSEQYGPPQGQYGYPQQQYNQPQQYGQQYDPQYGQGQPQSQWPQQPFAPMQMYDAPPQYHKQQPQAYAPAQLPQLSPQPSGFRPCVVPQITHKRLSGENMSPFTRVRVPELENKISSHQLIVFIDELNEAFMANPALQATNTAGNLAGMAPSMIAQLVGVGVNVAAGIGSSVTTKVRTKKYLAKANEELFHPQDLHVQICKTDKMLEYIGLGGQQNVSVRQQYRNAFDSAQQVPVNESMGPYEAPNHPVMQRMSSLGNRVMTLSFDNVEAATMPEGFWKKWGAKEASKADQKQVEKMMKDQDRADRRAQRRGGRGSSRRQDRQDEKKAKEAKKVLWIVITTKDQIAGKDDEWDSGSEDSGDHKN